MSKFVQRHELIRQCAAEVIGTAYLIMFGVGASIQMSLSDGSFLMIAIAWGIALMIGLYIAGGISGGHLNPAISTAFALFKGFSWSSVLPYSISQIVGSFIGTLLACSLNYPLLATKHEFSKTSARAVVGFPHPNVSLGWAIVNEIAITAVFLCGIFAICDERNVGPDPKIRPVLIGTLYTGLILSFGLTTSCAVNPASDLAQRIVAYFFGWDQIFSYDNHYFWVPMTMPFIGAVLGGMMYKLVVARIDCIDSQVENADQLLIHVA